MKTENKKISKSLSECSKKSNNNPRYLVLMFNYLLLWSPKNNKINRVKVEY